MKTDDKLLFQGEKNPKMIHSGKNLISFLVSYSIDLPIFWWWYQFPRMYFCGTIYTRLSTFIHVLFKNTYPTKTLQFQSEYLDWTENLFEAFISLPLWECYSYEDRDFYCLSWLEFLALEIVIAQNSCLVNISWIK